MISLAGLRLSPSLLPCLSLRHAIQDAAFAYTGGEGLLDMQEIRPSLPCATAKRLRANSYRIQPSSPHGFNIGAPIITAAEADAGIQGYYTAAGRSGAATPRHRRSLFNDTGHRPKGRPRRAFTSRVSITEKPLTHAA